MCARPHGTGGIVQNLRSHGAQQKSAKRTVTMRRHHDKVEMPIAHITEDDLRRITSFKVRDYHAITEYPGDQLVHFLAGSRDLTLVLTIRRCDLDNLKRG